MQMLSGAISCCLCLVSELRYMAEAAPGRCPALSGYVSSVPTAAGSRHSLIWESTAPYGQASQGLQFSFCPPPCQTGHFCLTTLTRQWIYMHRAKPSTALLWAEDNCKAGTISHVCKRYSCIQSCLLGCLGVWQCPLDLSSCPVLSTQAPFISCRGCLE